MTNLPRWTLVLTLIALLGQACGGDDYGDGDDGYGDDPPTAAELDQWAQETLDEGSHAEARAWLRLPNNATFEASKDDVKRFVSALYEAGARKVYITGIEPFGGSNLSASLLVELPASSTARAAIFAEEAKFIQEHVGGDASQDVGQRYLEVYWD